MKRPLLVPSLIVMTYFSASQAMAEIDYFSMSPAELAATPVSIATGTPKTVFQ
ncbi:MAG: hypothetical protein CG439_923, partial [Methylococcaceae bacterium NSP1-2]